MATLTIDHQEIIKELRRYILDVLPDALPTQVIQSTQNNAPLPQGAIVISMLFSSALDYTATRYDGANGKAGAQNSVEQRVQIDFYGPSAEKRSKIVETLWRSIYTTDALKICQPLYVQSRERHPYVNESKQYEDRYVLDVALQYNPMVIYDQDFAEEVGINLKLV